MGTCRSTPGPKCWEINFMVSKPLAMGKRWRWLYKSNQIWILACFSIFEQESHRTKGVMFQFSMFAHHWVPVWTLDLDQLQRYRYGGTEVTTLVTHFYGDIDSMRKDLMMVPWHLGGRKNWYCRCRKVEKQHILWHLSSKWFKWSFGMVQDTKTKLWRNPHFKKTWW